MTSINSNAAIFLLRGIFGVLYRAWCTFLEMPIIIQKGSTTQNSVQLLRSEALAEICGDFFALFISSDFWPTYIQSYLIKNEEEWSLIPLILYPRKSKSSKTSFLTDSRRNFPWIHGETFGSPTLMPSPGSGGAKEHSPLKEPDPGLQWAQNKLSKSSGAYASWEVRQCSDMILGNSINVLNLNF